jgi:Ni/Co efflux regulator RcnB
MLTTLAGAAMAGSDDSRRNRSDDRSYPSRDRDEQRRDDNGYDRNGYDRNGYQRRDWRDDHNRYDRGRYSPPRAYAPRYWRRGDRLPHGYMSRPYVVRDYRDLRLYAPPRGYHWVRVNNDVVLAAIVTGVVLDVLYNRFY